MPPVVVSELPNRLRMRVQVGTNPETGRPVVRNLSFGGIKPNAGHQAVYDVAVLLGAACQYPVVQFVLEENKDLSS